MKSRFLRSIVPLGLAAALPSFAAEIDITDISLTPDGTNATEELQTDIRPANGGGNVLPSVNGTVVYTVTTFTFGADSDAHFLGRFNATGTQPRLGVQVTNDGGISFVSTNDPGRTSVDLAQDMAGQTVTLLIKQHYDSSNDSLRVTLGTSDDTLMTVWVNPDNTDVEGSGLGAGDMQTLWNSANYGYWTQTIQNQSTPGTAGDSSITATKILTGTDATFANALALATGGTPPTGVVDAATSTVSAAPGAVPADSTSTATVTVTLKETDGTPVAGKEVSLSGNGSAIIETTDNISDSGGVVTFTVKSGTVGTEVFTATDVTDSNLVITETASVDFQAVLPVDAGQSSVVASPASVPADGTSTSTVTVTLRDGNGTVVVGEGVTLSGSPAGATIDPVGAATTDANGEATFTVSSGTIGTVTFTATSVTDTVTVTQTADVDFLDPAAQLGIAISDISLVPDGTNATEVLQTDLRPLNDGNNVLPSVNGTVVYTVTTFTFGAVSDAHFIGRFNATGTQPRLGVRVQDNGVIDFVSTGDPGRTSVDLAQDMAGQTVTLLIKQHYDSSNDSLRTTQGTSDDTLMTVWVNPDNADVEGSGLTAGDMHTLWNSANYGYYTQTIENQSTPGSAGESFITDTVILTGADATFANALALATGGAPPTGEVDAGTSTVTASPGAVAADGTTMATITVTLKDSGGSPVAGKEVSLSGNGSAIIENTDNISDPSGVVTFTVKSGTVGVETFTATDVTDGLVITQTTTVDFLDLSGPLAFNVSFLDEGQANVTGLVGVVGDPGETWNQGIGTSGSPVSNLVDTTGAVTSSVSVSGLGSDGRTLNSADLTVFNGTRNLFGKGGDVTMSITGLIPDAAYDLYIYSLSHNASPWGDVSNSERGAGDFVTTNTVLGNGQSQFLDNGTPGTSDDVFVPNGNYVAFESIVADGSGNISVLVDAYDGDGDRGTASTRLHVNGLQIRPASGMSADYTAWRDAYYPGLGLPDDDDDGDNLSNDYERIFGLDPTDAASNNPYPVLIDQTGSFTYTRRTPSLVNMTYRVWYSTNLVDWTEDNAANQVVQSVVDDVEAVSVNIDPSLLGEAKLFVQVRATPVTGVDPEPSLVNLWGSGSSITLLFSEPMNPSSAGNPANYTVVQDGVGAISVTGATPSADGGSVTLMLASTLGLDTGYTVDIDGVTSGTGQSLGSGVSRQFTTWDDDPAGIKVFIVAGQSNMVGFGETERGNGDVTGAIGSLRYLALNNASYPEYDYTSLLDNPADTNSAFRTRADVKVWYRDGGNGALGGAIKKGDLGPPFMGRDTGKIGPEFAFGQVLGDFYPANDVLIVKCAWGGRDLAEKFRPPSAVADRGGQVGDFYSATIDYTREVLTNLDTEFPAWAGQGYEIVGFGWHQGYNDRISTTFSAEYKDNLPDLISDLREVFNKPNLPFVIASTGMGGGAVEATPYSGYSLVEQAQLWVAGVVQPAEVRSTDTRPFWREAGDSPASQGFHWNQNGETYFRIGKAMGDDMVDLLTP